jgi:hypothetical protein
MLPKPIANSADVEGKGEIYLYYRYCILRNECLSFPAGVDIARASL